MCLAGPTRVIPFDLASQIGVDYAATSPNLLASFVRIVRGESVETTARATSQAFYVIRGSGESSSPEHGEWPWPGPTWQGRTKAGVASTGMGGGSEIRWGVGLTGLWGCFGGRAGLLKWSTGDLFVLPQTTKAVNHACTSGEEDAALYWVSDEPLLKYLGVSPCEKKFEPTLFKRERMVETVELLRHEEGVGHRNRLGE